MFTHLHTHTEYSLLDGMSKIPELMDRVKALGMESVAMTDHGGLYGALDFYREGRARGLNPIIGVEAYVARTTRQSRERAESQPYHLVLLARNLQGYKNLIALVTKANLEGFYYKPRMDRELLEKYSEGLVALSGCPSSEFFGHLMDGNRQGAIDTAKWYREVFDGHYYLEVQEHAVERFSRINPLIADVGRELGIPVLATNDSHFTLPGQHEAHEVLLCIGTNATMESKDRFKLDGEGYHVRSEEEMLAAFPESPEFIRNTQLVAESCDLDLTFDRQLLPEPDVPEGKTSDGYLAELCYRGLEERKGTALLPEELRDRLDYELEVLRQTGFTDYMYVVKEISDFAHREGIPMGVRGSAAASLVLYSLGVTDIDPVENRLVFERFLNLERREMPDVDFDFADDRRDDVIRYAYDRYGNENVAQIITFGTLGAKAALRDVGRALGMSYGDTDRVARVVPTALHITLGEALEQSVEMKEMYDADATVRRLVDTARQLEGVARHASTHAAGVVISRDPLSEHVPLQRPNRGDESSIPTTQFAMDQVAAIGLLKMDFLGLSNLTILGRAVELIRATTGDEVDLVGLPDGDPKTMAMLGEGETFGVFQLESAGMRRYIQDLKPTNIADICAMVALYRPGPMQHIPRYIQGAHAEIEIEYPHPALAEILDETHGVIVYQDQVLLIARMFAGYSLGQADIMRKAMGKKKAEIMAQERTGFIEGAVRNGYTEEEAASVFDLIEPFAGYAFNKAHSWCYGNIAYQTAYLKANYPAQYMTALLQLSQNAPDTFERVRAAAAECARLDIELLPPHINESAADFRVQVRQDGSLAIRFGLGVIKNVGQAAVEGITAAREKDGPYRNIEDFCKRADLSGATSRTIEHLAMAGAFDGLETRGTLRANSERIAGLAKRERELRESGQSTMFDLFGDEVDTPMPALELTPVVASTEEMLAWERELLGVYISEHPFHAAARDVSQFTSHTLAELTMELVGQTVTVAGMVNGIQSRMTRDGRRFYIVDLEDLSGTAEISVWSDTIELTGEEMWREGQVVLASLDCRERRDRLALSVRKAVAWDREAGRLVGFAPEQWQVEPQKSERPRPANGHPRNGNGHAGGNGRAAATNGNGGGPAAAPLNQPEPAQPLPETARLVVTIYETDDVMADEALLKTVAGMLKAHPGKDEVRLVVHDSEGLHTEFDLPMASVSEELARSIERVLSANKGTAVLTRTGVATG